MEKEKYDLVFVVLTYRNTNDLSNFIKVTNEKILDKYKIIVVNSFFDDESKEEFYDIAMRNNCDFINIPNKGYGYGNNIGIDFAKKNYLFKYLIISNPDIEIVEFSMDNLYGQENYIIAPTIKTLSGKNQNPFYYSEMSMVDFLKYQASIREKKTIAYVGIGINKIHREINLFLDKLLNIKKREIYALHGSFIIFGCNALDKLGKVYNEEMFLLHEENHLAKLAKSMCVKTYMIPAIKVLHREDGSIGLESSNISEHGRKSFITYYEKWNK